MAQFKACTRQIMVILVATVIGTLGVSRCHAETINEGTEEFCQLSGFVYQDVNNDGIRGSKEWVIPDVEIALMGTTYLGDAVHLVTTTGNTGAYAFTNLLAGTYAIVETQPYFLHTAKPSELGHITNPLLGIELADNVRKGDLPTDPDKFTGIQLVAGDQGTEYNFGELGLKAKYMSKRDFIIEVPEASTLSLLVTLLAGVSLYRFRRRSR